TTPVGRERDAAQAGRPAAERRFLERLDARLAGGVPVNEAHPLPPPVERVPVIGYRRVDSDDLLGSFVAMAESVGARVHLVAGTTVPEDLLADVVARHQVRRVVTSAEPEALLVGDALRALDPAVDVSLAAGRRTETAAADLGVTSAAALVAATGSLALDCAVVGDRTVSLLPRVHLCVASADRLVASPGDLWRAFDDRDAAPLPSNLVLVPGPSRTGDIAQLLTIGVHGPTAVEIVVTGAPRP
ncbi:MAG: Lactate utilization protein, partial [Acidimicrobiales bacterium]|nr:Lactate utilization protein [Acidimicrobiales bacterium]